VSSIIKSLHEAGFEQIGFGAQAWKSTQPVVFYVTISKKAGIPAESLKPEVTLIDIKASGSGPDQTIEINKKPIELTDIKLKRLLRGRPARPVIIKAPKDKPNADVLWVISTVKGHGAQKIEIQIDDLQ
jgi:biopolymer transport protein ExbD